MHLSYIHYLSFLKSSEPLPPAINYHQLQDFHKGPDRKLPRRNIIHDIALGEGRT